MNPKGQSSVFLHSSIDFLHVLLGHFIGSDSLHCSGGKQSLLFVTQTPFQHKIELVSKQVGIVGQSIGFVLQVLS